MTSVSSLPRISLVTPSFQQGRFLALTLESVVEQRYPNLEHLVIDGGSTDSSRAVIREYERHLAYWCSEKDRGQTHAINKGLQRATGEIVGWLNSDDILLPGALYRIAQAYADPSVQATCGWNISIDECGRFLHKRVFPQPSPEVLLHRSLLPQEAVFWRRSLIDRIGLLDESFHYRMDTEYWVRMAKHGLAPKLIPSLLGAFRRHGEQKTVQQQAVDAEWKRIMEGVHGPGVDLKKLRGKVPLSFRFKFRIYKRLNRWGYPALPATWVGKDWPPA